MKQLTRDEHDHLKRRFEEKIPVMALRIKYQNQIRQSCDARKAKISVRPDRADTIEAVWDYCFNMVFYVEEFNDAYRKAMRAFFEAIEDHEYSVQQAEELLELHTNNSSIPDVMSVLFKERLDKIPEDAIQGIIQRFMELVEIEDGTYDLLYHCTLK